MKLARWQLYIVSTLFFLSAFIYINSKFDPYYRVNGIDNDNRALIEQYLNEYEQTYLIENAIAMNEFVQYIHIPNFNLPYYQYYNLLSQSKLFNDPISLINNTNTLIERLELTQQNDVMQYCKEIIENDLVLAFINQNDFDLLNISLYQKVRALYSVVDYNFISDTNNYVNLLLQDYERKDLPLIFDQLCSNYTKSTLSTLMYTIVDVGVERVFDPTVHELIIDETTFIGNYAPSKLLVAKDIKRTNYSIYLEEETYKQFLLMYHDVTELYGENLLLSGGYKSYDLLMQQQSTIKAGYNELQLGTSIELVAYGYSSDVFFQSDYATWLEQNAHTYGFVKRYQEDNTSNVYRYVGVELAILLFQEQLTFDVYIKGELVDE